MNEFSVPQEELDIGPRSVSIAITEVCNLHCPFCYARLGRSHLPLSFVCELASGLDRLGVLELTLGGGEPTLHPDLAGICRHIWHHTRLGLSITTHGHNLSESLLEAIAPCLSTIRFSMDGPEPRYSQVRGRPLSALIAPLRAAKKRARVGINCVVSPAAVAEAEEVLKIAMREEVNDILLIPEHRSGIPTLSEKDWKELDQLIAAYQERVQICLSRTADGFLTAPTLDTAVPDEFHFCHVTADMSLQAHSYGGRQFCIADLSTLADQLAALKGSLS
ncbi:radical SAM protein [Chthoniobacter flavus]|uniref:radical SAM protein n=1 Tax=Chthoniobacter flavus TaxID=191863 RepID=UPI00104532C2|nr:radical SAM protein [Chthoniobacter flavus]